MAINPNTDFSPGQVFTAGQADRFPRGVMARAVSTTSYALTTSNAQATGMSVTFTAEAGRFYKITYYEPQAQTPNVLGNTQSFLRQSTVGGTILGNCVIVNETATNDQSVLIIVKTMTFSAGSVTLLGTAQTSSTSGTPNFVRDAGREALLLVEDIGPA
jgi:hypothetical protein